MCNETVANLDTSLMCQKVDDSDRLADKGNRYSWNAAILGTKPYRYGSDPCIDQSAFCPTNQSSPDRSAMWFAGAPGGACFAFFGDGSIAGSGELSTPHVRAVCSGL